MVIIPIIFISIIFSMTGDELTTLMDNRKTPDDISSDMNMEIVNKKGRKRKDSSKAKENSLLINELIRSKSNNFCINKT